MGGREKAILVLGFSAWIGLGLAHNVIVMTSENGLRPDRSAPGADAVVGHPHYTDPRTVAGPLRLAAESDGTAETDLLLIVPEGIDDEDLFYRRFQLVHLLYPRRVRVERDTAEAAWRSAADSMLLVTAPGARSLPGCGVSAQAHDHLLLTCNAR